MKFQLYPPQYSGVLGVLFPVNSPAAQKAVVGLWDRASQYLDRVVLGSPQKALMVFTGPRSLAKRVGVWRREGKAALWEEGDVPRPPSSVHEQRQNPADLETP